MVLTYFGGTFHISSKCKQIFSYVFILKIFKKKKSVVIFSSLPHGLLHRGAHMTASFLQSKKEKETTWAESRRQFSLLNESSRQTRDDISLYSGIVVEMMRHCWALEKQFEKCVHTIFWQIFCGCTRTEYYESSHAMSSSKITCTLWARTITLFSTTVFPIPKVLNNLNKWVNYWIIWSI